MQSRIDEIRALDGEVLAISVDPPDKGRKISEAYGLSFSLLSDPGLEAIDAFGVRHSTGGVSGEDIARPATFILDREGRVAWYDLTENWRVRPRPSEILAQLAEIP